MKKALFLFVFIFCVIFMRARELDSLLQELDASIKERAVGFRQKENSLSLLMKKLSKSSSEKQKYGLLKKIMYEYSYYRIDSAIFYADKCIASATLLKYSDEIIELQMQKAYFLGFLNQFHKSFQLMEAINFEDLSLPLQKKYIYIMILIYHNKVRELENDQIKKEYNLEIKKKIDLYFKIEKNGHMNI